MMEFKPITLENKEVYEKYLHDGRERGCEYSFANLYLWGHQHATIFHNHMVIFSQFYGNNIYPYPIGEGDKKVVLDAIIADAKKRRGPYRITGLYAEERKMLEKLYPDQFSFHYDRGSYDYVYSIDDLAELKGKKYHRKRNHYNRFRKKFPNYKVEALSEGNLLQVKQMINVWYETKIQANPDQDYQMERTALEKAFCDYQKLNMEGLVLLNGEELVAITLGSRMSDDTFDVHFEKALSDVDGAYTAINCEFAQYIRDKYSEIRFLNREEDMGIEGLRKSKESYYPHHMIEKCWACLKEDEEEYIDNPDKTQISDLKGLWQEAFDDTEEFLEAFETTAFRIERCRCVMKNGKLAAALYWFDCMYMDKPIAYLYAVATAKEFRRQGICHKLMEDTHMHLKQLGYEGVILVPGHKELFQLYEDMGYKTCSWIKEVNCVGSLENVHLDVIDKNQYAKLRRKLLPARGVVQEKENLDFLETYAKFYAGESFLLAAYGEGGILHGIELLGDTKLASGIVHKLGYSNGIFRMPGDGVPYAMYYSLGNSILLPPDYFGLAFD